MQLSSDLNKQAQKEIFSRKLEKEVHLIRSNFQKHLGVYLDTKLNLTHHVKEKLKKAIKAVVLIRKLHFILPGIAY